MIMGRVTEFLAGYVVPAGAGLAGEVRLKASRHSTGGALRVFETSIAAGPPLHVRDREDECFHVLDASCPSAAATTRSAPQRAASSSCLAGVRTGSRPRAGPARLLMIAVPGGIEDYFREINAAATDDECHQVGERYAIRVVPG